MYHYLYNILSIERLGIYWDISVFIFLALHISFQGLKYYFYNAIIIQRVSNVFNVLSVN